MYSQVDNFIQCKKWYYYGKLHRLNDKPAEIIYFINYDIIESEAWYIEGQKHRLIKPAYIKYCSIDNNSQIQIKNWYYYGLLHRENGPAVIEYYKNNGLIRNEIWYQDGKTYYDPIKNRHEYSYTEKGYKI
jgi:hypothetical protein